jgi:hypothetical protein
MNDVVVTFPAPPSGRVRSIQSLSRGCSAALRYAERPWLISGCTCRCTIQDLTTIQIISFRPINIFLETHYTAVVMAFTTCAFNLPFSPFLGMSQLTPVSLCHLCADFGELGNWPLTSGL